jgi:hypothetical protein
VNEKRKKNEEYEIWESKVIKPQIILSSNIDQELSKIESNLNKPITNRPFALRLHPSEPPNFNQDNPDNYRHTKILG